MILVYEAGHPLRFHGSPLFASQQSYIRTSGDSAFSSYAPKLWNSLQEDLRGVHNLDSFKCKLKTHLSHLAITYNVFFLPPLYYELYLTCMKGAIKIKLDRFIDG